MNRIYAIPALCSILAFAGTAFAAQTNLVETTPAGAVDVTVYSSGFAQIEETRQVPLLAGRNRVQLTGISAQYRPDSLRLFAVEGPGKFTFKSATYKSANLSWEQILSASIGQRVTAGVEQGGNDGQISGILVAVTGNRAIIRTDNSSGGPQANRGHILPPPGGFAGGGNTQGNVFNVDSSSVVVSSLPAGLSSTASLVVEAEVETAGLYNLGFLYETGGINWKANHSLIYNDESKKVENFETVVSVRNDSGTDFSNATLWLLSGDIRRVGSAESVPQQLGNMRYQAAAAAPASFDSADVESLGERKVYRIKENVDLANGQSRQIPLFRGENVKADLHLAIATGQYLYDNRSDAQPVPVEASLKLKNCKADNLGSPLPAGTVTVYQRNSESRLQLTAATHLREVAVDENFKVSLGASSDIKSTIRFLSSAAATNPDPVNQPRAEYEERTYQVVINNYKDKDRVAVDVEVALNSDVRIYPPLQRVSANLARGAVNVDAGKAETLTYKLLVRTR